MRYYLLLASLVISANAFTADCGKIKQGYCEGKPMALIANASQFLMAKTPWNGATLLAHALILYQYNPIEAEKLLVLSLHESRLDKVNASSTKGSIYKGYRWRRTEDYLLGQIKKNPQCLRAMSVGATPKNGYQLDKSKIKLKFRVQTKYVGSIEKGRYTVFICTSGQQTCRAVTLKRNLKGYWKATGFSSLAVGCYRSSASTAQRNEKSAADEL